MTPAVLYLRVSSKRQKEEGYSIPAQKKLLREYAKANDFKIVKEFEDDETAKNTGRKEFGEMVKLLKNNKEVNTILVEKTDRLYRNHKDYVVIDELGVTVFLVKENEVIGKGASSHQKFVHDIKLAVAKNYIDNLSEEVRKGQKTKAEQGFYPGGVPPVGYILERVEGKSTLKIDKTNKQLPIKMFEYYATGRYSLDSLIKKIKDEGLFIPSNFPHHSTLKTLAKSTMNRILRNHLYYGAFMWNKKMYQGSHKPLITKELWSKVQKVLNKQENRGAESKYNTLPFLFKGLLTCGECGRTITAEKKIKPSGKEYVYYRCTKFNKNCSQKAVNEKVIDKQIEDRLTGLEVPEETIDYITEGLKQSLNLKRTTEDYTRKNLESRKNKLQDQLDTMYEDKLNKIITLEFYQKKSEEYSQEILDLDDKISRYTRADINFYNFGSKILELAKRAGFLYKNATLSERQELLNFLLSNSKLKDGKVLILFKKPFDTIYQRASCSDWRRGRDSNPRCP